MPNRKPGRPVKQQPLQRQAARDAGLKRYWPIEPCKRGHRAERFVSNNGCVACHDTKRGKHFSGERVVDEQTPERERWLAHRKAAREKYQRRVPHQLINQTGAQHQCPPNDLR